MAGNGHLVDRVVVIAGGAGGFGLPDHNEPDTSEAKSATVCSLIGRAW